MPAVYIVLRSEIYINNNRDTLHSHIAGSADDRVIGAAALSNLLCNCCVRAERNPGRRALETPEI